MAVYIDVWLARKENKTKRKQKKRKRTHQSGNKARWLDRRIKINPVLRQWDRREKNKEIRKKY